MSPPCLVSASAAFRAGYTTISGVQYLAALDLVCSDGKTVLDPGPGSTARASLIFSTSPASGAGSLLSRASAVFEDAFFNFRAGSEVVQADIQLACSGSYAFLGANTERWAAGQNGTLGTQYKGAAK